MTGNKNPAVPIQWRYNSPLYFWSVAWLNLWMWSRGSGGLTVCNVKSVIF